MTCRTRLDVPLDPVKNARRCCAMRSPLFQSVVCVTVPDRQLANSGQFDAEPLGMGFHGPYGFDLFHADI